MQHNILLLQDRLLLKIVLDMLDMEKLWVILLLALIVRDITRVFIRQMDVVIILKQKLLQCQKMQLLCLVGLKVIQLVITVIRFH
jgi:hypothetical protein